MRNNSACHGFSTEWACQRGAALILVLVTVSILGLMAGMAGQSWRTVTQRAREADLLWCGEQYRQAVRSYYQVRQGSRQAYPARLEDLLQDPRFPQPVRHLRRLYKDPMTGEDWEVIRAPEGGVAGVRSRSRLRPFRQDGFPKEQESFAQKESYREWEFIYRPGRPSEPAADKAVPADKRW